MQENHIYYLAALIDGEGYIDSRRPRISISSTDLDILERAQEFAGMGNIVGPYMGEKSTKEYWEWNVTTVQDVARLACAIAPLMSNRRQEKLLELAEALSLRTKPVHCLSCDALLDSKMRINAAQYCNSTCRSRKWRKERRRLDALSR